MQYLGMYSVFLFCMCYYNWPSIYPDSLTAFSFNNVWRTFPQFLKTLRNVIFYISYMNEKIHYILYFAEWMFTIYLTYTFVRYKSDYLLRMRDHDKLLKFWACRLFFSWDNFRQLRLKCVLIATGVPLLT